MPLPIIGVGLGAIFASIIEFVAKQFVKSRIWRLIASIAIMEGLYLILNNAIQFFINYLTNRMGSIGLPPEMCWALDRMDFYNVISFYASILISFAFAKYFLRMAEKLI